MSEPRHRRPVVALPAQHGSWGSVLGLILLGLLVGGAWPGVAEMGWGGLTALL